MITYRQSLLSLTIGSVLGVSGVAGAQEASRSTGLEEIVVTAERRSESVLEVPLSISAFSDKTREQMGVISIQDMVNFSPGVSFNMATDRPSIRGIGRQSNFFSLDSPVANYNDGVYTSSVQDAQRRPIFIERTEILRGPQGALSGRGSIAGAFNTISKRPTETWQGEAGTFLGNYMRYGVEATVSGPITDWLRTRVNGGVYKQNEGYFENVSRGDTEGDQPNNRSIVDVLFDGNLGENVEFFAKASFSDYDESRRTGISTAPFYAGNLSAPSAYGVDGALVPQAGFGYFPASGGVRLGDVTNNPAFLSDDYHKFANDFHSNQKLDNHHNYTMHLTWHTGPVDVKWIGGHQNYRYTQLTDVDTTDVLQMRLPATAAFPTGRLVSPGGTNLYMEQREWYSNELTFASTSDGPFNWIFGLYQSNEDYNQEPATTTYPGYEELNRPVRFIGPGGGPLAVQPNSHPYSSVVGMFDGETVSQAAFLQLDYQITDQFKITAGARYNKDEKEVQEAFRYIGNNVTAGLAPILAGGGLGVPLALDVTPLPTGAPLPKGVVRDYGIDPADGFRKRDFEGEWNAVTGSVGLDYKPDDNNLIFVRAARGYRPGGFNAGFNYDPPMADEETVNSYEIGYKATLFDRVQFSSSAFLYDYQDIQLPLPVLGRCSDPNDLSTCTILNSFVNVPEGESRGIELEVTYAATENLSFYLSYGWLDTEIKDGLVDGRGFSNPDDPAALLPNANRLSVLETRATPASPPVVQVDSFTGLPRWTQDLTGNSLANSPEHRVAFNTSYTFNLSPGSLTLSGTWIWRDEQYSDVFETTPAIVPSYDTIGARLLWIDASDRYTVILYGNNLTDADAPDSAGTTRLRTGLASAAAPGAQGQAYYKTYNFAPPREYGIELQYRFGN